MAEGQTYGQCLIIWGWLIVLLLVSIGASALSISPALIVLIIFGLAAVKALLVALYYMHLRWEHFAISLLALTPVILFVILTLALFPDFVR